MSNFEKYTDSLARLLSYAKRWNFRQRVSLTSALDRILATDIIANENYPEFKTACMDGYACKFEDISGKSLKIIGVNAAGSEAELSIKNGECVKTFTGSIMPDGSDTLIPIEYVKVDDDVIFIQNFVQTGYAVRAVGESYKKGDILLRRGDRLNYASIALLAQLGFGYVDVLVKPRVAILNTGSEILDLGEIKKNTAHIYSSNGVAIANLVAKFGCEPILMPVLKDDFSGIKQEIGNALKNSDFLITTGGVSVGDFDFVKEILKNEFELIVNGAAIKPGRHIKIAKFQEKFIFSLPGFPYSSIVTCLLFFREFINEILGTRMNFTKSAILDHDFVRKSEFCEFVAADLRNENGTLRICTTNKKTGSSAIINNLNESSVLLICPMDKQKLFADEVVEFIEI